MKNSTLKTYREFRKSGWLPRQALHASRTIELWDKLESCGLVELEAVPDVHADIEDLKGDMFNRDANPEIQESRMAREEKEFEDSIARDGVWGSVGKFRVSSSDEWQTGDSVWGHTGYRDVLSPFENCYIIDIMHATIEELRKALQSRCPCCRKAA